MNEPTKQGFAVNKPVGAFANWDTSRCDLDIADAIAEIEREANVRMKCYDRWVAEKRMTHEEAVKRLASLVSAWHFLQTTEAAKASALAQEQAEK